MGLRFRQSFTLFPGVRLNVSKSGVSASFGVPGATLNLSSRGLKSTVGLPGTGLSHQTNHGFGTTAPRTEPPRGDQDSFNPGAYGSPLPAPAPAIWSAPAMRQIGSASIEQLTSEGLRELRQLIADARAQRSEIDEDLAQAHSLLDAQCAKLSRRQNSLFRMFYKRRIAELEQDIPLTRDEVERLATWREATHVDIRFESGDAAKKAYAALVRAFDVLRSSSRVWDITSDRDTHRVLERTTAARVLNRTTAVIEFSASDLVRFEGRAMRFQNVNGEDILLYPGMAVMPRADGAFALIDIREIQLDSHAVQFIEEEAVPADTEVVAQTWAKCNKDGSPDRRFANNYAIPVCLYGRLLFSSAAGIEEEYQVSNAQAAAAFGQAFNAYQAAIGSA